MFKTRTSNYKKWVFRLCMQEGSCSKGTGQPLVHLGLSYPPYGFRPVVSPTVRSWPAAHGGGGGAPFKIMRFLMAKAKADKFL